MPPCHHWESLEFERSRRGIQRLMAGKGLIREATGRPGALVIWGICQSSSRAASLSSHLPACWAADVMINGLFQPRSNSASSSNSITQSRSIAFIRCQVNRISEKQLISLLHILNFLPRLVWRSLLCLKWHERYRPQGTAGRPRAAAAAGIQERNNSLCFCL